MGKLHGEAMVHAHNLPQVAGAFYPMHKLVIKRKKKKIVILKI